MSVLMALVLASGVVTSVEYDHRVDFSRSKTWSWHGGNTPAMNPVTDKAIRDAIEKSLAARGLSRVDAAAALHVVYHAARTTQIETLSSKVAAAPASGIRYSQKGSLVVELLDAASDRVVWRGEAAGLMKYGPQEIADQVQAAIAELLDAFPPAVETGR